MPRNGRPLDGVSAAQSTQCYALGKLIPGPTTIAAMFIGYAAAGPRGAALAAVAMSSERRWHARRCDAVAAVSRLDVARADRAAACRSTSA